MVLMEVLEGRSVGYGGQIHPPGSTFLCKPKYVADIVAQKLAKAVETKEDEVPAEAPVVSETAKAEERQALFDELEALGVTASQKTNTKTLKSLVERARMEARQ